MTNFNLIFPKFDRFLSEKSLVFEATVIGGAALQLLGITDRVTKDCDVLSPPLSEDIKSAAHEFAKQHGLALNWLNDGPESLQRDLPENWRDHIRELFRGTNLKLFTLSRTDLLRSKLFAFIDRGIDLDDLKRMRPAPEELEEVREWLKERDANPQWPDYVEIRLEELKKELYGDAE